MKKFVRFSGILLLVIFIAWGAMVLVDYVTAIKRHRPIFCVKEYTKKYDDGSVYACEGIGYRYYYYNRGNIKASEFGPFFIDEKDISEFKNNK